MINPRTGKEMKKEKERIMCYGIDKANMRLFRYLFSEYYDITDVTECFTDILAVNAAAVFINPEYVSQKDFDSMNEVFEDYRDTVIAFTDEPLDTAFFPYYLIDLGKDNDINMRVIEKYLKNRKRLTA